MNVHVCIMNYCAIHLPKYFKNWKIIFYDIGLNRSPSKKINIVFTQQYSIQELMLIFDLLNKH